jgi:hypothetical protein
MSERDRLSDDACSSSYDEYDLGDRWNLLAEQLLVKEGRFKKRDEEKERMDGMVEKGTARGWAFRLWREGGRLRGCRMEEWEKREWGRRDGDWDWNWDWEGCTSGTSASLEGKKTTGD